ncbi:acetyl-CoA C-acetyltransferase [Gordonia terrae]|uniref:Acetyl-CoA C-acetyltransferase n=2 Tax=Gordonia terrae TaxID=2055 RepID=A0AAD0KBM5_9ACTN|nr:acetyl-CoA C-acetyltransferase [Gordonia terrae]ANY22237.1 acetyl-CoA acetyltransferase [Gordonia terrae]AWO82976.1 acetyl-CoA C-acetyltransferase [Gordonia terrae]VTS30318.1 Beta-ketoadipyl-CoA thiolase [Gordonia terrae]
MPEAIIAAAARSPIGRAAKGSLVDMRADDLVAQIISGALEQIPQLDPTTIDDLVLGCAQPAGEQGYNLGRMAALRLDLDTVPGTTVHRYCASSLQAIRIASHAIRAGEGHAFVAAGVETVSRYPLGKADGMPETRNQRYARSEERTDAGVDEIDMWADPRDTGRVPDAYMSMGETAENVARLYGVSREDQDRFAVRSQNLAEAAIARGFYERDITPVTRPDGTVVRADDSPRSGVTVDGISEMTPVFRPDGTVTAANCCPLNDGAAALVVMSDVRARELGVEPLARVVSTGVSALSPEIMGLGPIEASRAAVARAGLTLADIDLVEINEAFAAQVLPCVDELGIDFDRVNVNGGAIALGHPFGSTGARMATTLLHGLQERQARYGLETMCAAGGQGMAMVIERLS